jgi:hypothetical protein
LVRQNFASSPPCDLFTALTCGPYVGCCNTRGVCHQLSSGFELKHDSLSGDEDVKVKPMEASPNLNLDVAPLLYI